MRNRTLCRQLWPRLGALALAGLLVGCTEANDPASPAAEAVQYSAGGGGIIPSPVANVNGFEFWPYTGTDLAGTVSDPINLIFPGADPRDIRAALLNLNGDRSAFGFPNVAPFDCTWADAVGSHQTGWTAATGWVGSVIQLECGDFGPAFRFHLRLFPGKGFTFANAHFEVLIPGTQQHEVLSWEFAERIVQFDLIRSGRLIGPVVHHPVAINPAPFRAINPMVFNLVPVPIRGILGLPTTPQAAPVPIPSDGRPTILNVAPTTADPGVLNRDFVVPFNQVIPKPFCASGPFDYLLVKGPITVRQRVVVTPSGNYISSFHAQGRLELTPVNPLTNPPTPIGETFSAVVNQHARNIITDRHSLVSELAMQIMLPPNAPFRGRLTTSLRVGPGESTGYDVRLDCN
jgi:hypothetical protein